MRALIVQHVDIEGPETLGTALEKDGWQLEVRQMDRPGASLPQDLSPYQALVVLGGPMGADDHDAYPHLAEVKRIIREAVVRGLPVLGICLGAQLIARAMGAKVYRNQVKEIGWYTLKLTPAGRRSPLFAGLPEEFPVFQWHADTFALPPGAVRLATTPTCLNQAFALGARVFGLQFHLEVTPEMARAWMQAYADDLPPGGGGQKRSCLRSLSEDSGRWREYETVATKFLQNLIPLLWKVRGWPGARPAWRTRNVTALGLKPLPPVGPGHGPAEIRAALVGLALTGWSGLLFYQVLSRLAIYLPAGGSAGGIFRTLAAAGELAQGLAFYLGLLVLLLVFLEERKGRRRAGPPTLTRSTLWGLIAALAAFSFAGGLRPFSLSLLAAYNALGLAVMVLFAYLQLRCLTSNFRPDALRRRWRHHQRNENGSVSRRGCGFGTCAASSYEKPTSHFPPLTSNFRWMRLAGLAFSLAWGMAFLAGLLHSSSQLWGWSLEPGAKAVWAAGQVVVLAGGMLLLLAFLPSSPAPGSGRQRWVAATLAGGLTLLAAMVYLAQPEVVAILVNWSLGLSLRLPLTVYLLSLAGYLYALLTLFLSPGPWRQAALALALLPVAGYSMPLAFNTLAAIVCLLLWEIGQG